MKRVDKRLEQLNKERIARHEAGLKKQDAWNRVEKAQKEIVNALTAFYEANESYTSLTQETLKA